LGLSEKDVQLIKQTFVKGINEMNASGLRYPGEGKLTAILYNNAWADDAPLGWLFGGTYKRCFGQAEKILADLNALKCQGALDDNWDFRMAHRPGHYWVEAVPVDPGSKDPVIHMDPWVVELSTSRTPAAETSYYGSAELEEHYRKTCKVPVNPPTIINPSPAPPPQG
jgi:hypothetical protein